MESEIAGAWGVFVGAIITLGGTIFVAERYTSHKKQQIRDDRYLDGCERLLTRVNDSIDRIIAASFYVGSYSLNPNAPFDSMIADIRFVEIGALQGIYARASKNSFDALSNCYREWIVVLRTVQTANSGDLSAAKTAYKSKTRDLLAKIREFSNEIVTSVNNRGLV